MFIFDFKKGDREGAVRRSESLAISFASKSGLRGDFVDNVHSIAMYSMHQLHSTT